MLNRVQRLCAVDGCINLRRARGWCGTHYERWRRTETVDLLAYYLPIRQSECVECGMVFEYKSRNLARRCPDCAGARERARSLAAAQASYASGALDRARRAAERKCADCGITIGDAGGRSGRPRLYCSDCRESRRRDNALRGAKAYKSRNPELVRKRRAAYRKRNAAILAEDTKRRYWEKTPEVRAEQRRRINWKPPREYKAEIQRRTRARKSAVESIGVSLRDWHRLCRVTYQGRCAYCSMPLAFPEQDHVIPLSRGGRHAIGNVVPACRTCNASKNNRLVIEWRSDIKRRIKAA